MEWAELVLEYVEALAWPVVFGGAVVLFRAQIAAKIKDLTEVSTPLGGGKFDADAKGIEAKAERAAARQDALAQPEPAPGDGPDDGTGTADRDSGAGPKPTPTQPPVESPTEPVQVPDDVDVPELTAEQIAGAHAQSAAERLRAMDELAFLELAGATEQMIFPPDFGTAREVSAVSPNAGIMLAYSEVEKVARAAWTIDRMEPSTRPRGLSSMVASLTRTGLDPEFEQVARELSDLRNGVAHRAGEVSTTGALDYIAACDRLTEALVLNAVSKLRHPSRSDVTQRLYGWFEEFGPADRHPG